MVKCVGKTQTEKIGSRPQLLYLLILNPSITITSQYKIKGVGILSSDYF